VAEEVDLKKAAVISGNKKAEMIHVKELPVLTGYVRGGCSPIGMKKAFPTYMDETAQLFDTIAVSAGIRGQMLLLSPDALKDFIGAEYGDLVK
ncbi:MAG: Cys-tRNA(Pro) deacylase, partial [Clostridia bacterium]|nr:Cys-tRNA(Pro) deacylase [Clostridia bacterium]